MGMHCYSLFLQILINCYRAKAEVLVTLTQDLGKILSSLHTLKISGETDFAAALQVAQVIINYPYLRITTSPTALTHLSLVFCSVTVIYLELLLIDLNSWY